jgi:serine/threonine protein kinase
MPLHMAERRIARGTDNAGLLLGDLALGTRVGEFVIQRRLGARGTGHIYQATHLVLPRAAVIHVLPAAEGELRSVALELMREACVVDAVDHPGMPRVFECGLLADRRPWIASELIDGRTVAHVLEGHTISVADLLAIVRDVADILATAHRRGLVHCHVSPASIVLPARSRRFPLCLVDWIGVRTHDSHTPLPLVVGSRYVAPEQANGIAVDAKSDVYSLGRIGRDLLDCVASEDVPPLFVVLLESMMSAERGARPSMSEVHRTTTWLANELVAAPEAPAPRVSAPEIEQTIEMEALEPDLEVTHKSGPITSELAAQVAGEIG